MTVRVDGPGESRAEAGQVSAAINRVDVVGERIDLFVIAVVVLNRDFDRKRVTNLFKIYRFVVQYALILIEMLDEFRDPSTIVKLV